ncbi:hypothetical protein [Piscirickettsia salmonis]|nr:hypothetical protein [Piscirickettsia salmonis]QNR79441.1 hypothetical protein ICC15_10235 [Piscirickettsia salmonis]
MLGDFASLDVQNTYRGSDAYVLFLSFVVIGIFTFSYSFNLDSVLGLG